MKNLKKKKINSNLKERCEYGLSCSNSKICRKNSRDEESSKLLKEIEELPSVDFRDYEGVTYLQFAALNHKLEIIKLLLKKGADPNCKDNRGRFAIIWALGRKNEKNPEILKLFLEYGLDLDIKKENDGLTIRETILSFELP